MATSFNVFNLGNSTELDVNETDGVVENAGLLTNLSDVRQCLPRSPRASIIKAYFGSVGSGFITSR